MPPCVALAYETLEGRQGVCPWCGLGYREASVGIDPDPLGVADEHVEDLVLVTDGFDMVGQRLRPGKSRITSSSAELLACRVGATLLVGPTDDGRGIRADAFAV